MLEALASGRRVVVSDVASTRDYHHPRLSRFPAGDQDALVGSLETALGSPTDDDERDEPFPYSTEATAAALINVIEKVLAGP